MDTSNKPISLYQLVYDWARYADADLGKSLDKKKIGKTFALAKSRRYATFFNGDVPQKVMFSFLQSGKFVDMGVGRGQKLGDVRGNQDIYAATGVKGRKAKKWFSKVIFPEANTLLRLMAENYGRQAHFEITENLDSKIQ